MKDLDYNEFPPTEYYSMYYDYQDWNHPPSLSPSTKSYVSKTTTPTSNHGSVDTTGGTGADSEIKNSVSSNNPTSKPSSIATVENDLTIRSTRPPTVMNKNVTRKKDTNDSSLQPSSTLRPSPPSIVPSRNDSISPTVLTSSISSSSSSSTVHNNNTVTDPQTNGNLPNTIKPTLQPSILSPSLSSNSPSYDVDLSGFMNLDDDRNNDDYYIVTIINNTIDNNDDEKDGNTILHDMKDIYGDKSNAVRSSFYVPTYGLVLICVGSFFVTTLLLFPLSRKIFHNRSKLFYEEMMDD
jgi:hypothetical protein